MYNQTRSDSLDGGTEAPAIVVIIDDDPLVRGAMDSLFRSVGLRTLTYESAQDLLDGPMPEGNHCLVVDIRMPQLSGLDFQTKLAERGDHAPIIFVTGHGDIPMSVKAMKAGAVDFLAKPFRDQDMLDAVAVALERGRNQRSASQDVAELRQRYESLTPREREVMALVSRGLMNKQAAGELGLQEITVRLHRSSMMRKMGTRTVVDLARMHDALKRTSHE